ncbi:MAG: glycerol kinase GlpK [Clostridia bacterium]|nr:glycerol kinase GlpK [Clostridia bacterium]
MKYIVSLDQGTTSSRAVIFDENGQQVTSHSIEFEQIYPHPGWVEHDPGDILSSQIDSLKIAVEKAGVSPADIAAIGITNQRETTIMWDRQSGNPIYNAIVWQCRRTAPLVERLKADGLSNVVRDITGLIPDAYFSATKIRWLLDNVDGARERAERGEMCFGTVDSFLAYNLTEEKIHVTDATNASRTMLFNIREQKWDEMLLRTMNIPVEIMPEVVDTSCVIGTLRRDILGHPIPIAALAGDQHAALFGQGCTSSGMVKNTYGTGCFMLMNTGRNPVKSQNGLLTTLAWRIDGKSVYALEGSVFIAGAVIQWLRDEVKLISSAAESEQLAQSVKDNGGVYIIPAFTGLGAPYWDMYARGTIVGLTRGAGRAHIVRAALESIAFQNRDVLGCMSRDSGLKPGSMRVDGGASANNFLMQFQADIADMAVVRPKIIETTALGAAMFAARAVGLWDDRRISSIWESQAAFVPRMPTSERQKLILDWQKAVGRSLNWENQEQQ